MTIADLIDNLKDLISEADDNESFKEVLKVGQLYKEDCLYITTGEGETFTLTLHKH